MDNVDAFVLVVAAFAGLGSVAAARNWPGGRWASDLWQRLEPYAGCYVRRTAKRGFRVIPPRMNGVVDRWRPPETAGGVVALAHDWRAAGRAGPARSVPNLSPPRRTNWDDWSRRSTRVSRHINAASATVDAALIDPKAIAKWKGRPAADRVACAVGDRAAGGGSADRR
jgi:hypothetical protein